MKIFDSWIEKQFYKRNPDIKTLMNSKKVTAISSEEIKPIKCMTMMSLDMNLDEVVPENKKKEMLAHQFTPFLINHMKVRKDEDAIARCAVYHAQIEIVPRKEKNNAI